MAPLTFSVITPSMNSAQYFGMALSSLFSQEGDFHIQSIIMDGASTDGTVEFLAETEQKLKDGTTDVRCLGIEMDWTSQKDNGQSEALNNALPKIQGDVVVWLNADDWFEPGAFQKVADAFAKDASLDIVLGDCLQMTSETELLEGAPTGSYVKDPARVSPFTGGDQWLLVTPEVFFRKRCIDDFRFDLFLDYFMDVDLWMHLFLKQPAWQKIDQPLASFRWHEECKTLKAWKRFMPRLLAEDMVLYSRHSDKLDTAESERAFTKLMLHFINNWHSMGVYHDNDAHLAEFLGEYEALNDNARSVFGRLYAAAQEQYGKRKES